LKPFFICPFLLPNGNVSDSTERCVRPIPSHFGRLKYMSANTPSQTGTPTLAPAIDAAVRELCAAAGAVLIEAVVRGSHERRIVELYVDKPDGISLDECGALSERIGELLEAKNAFPAAYRLEVSSPGVSRPLQYSWQYARNTGRLLTLQRMSGETVKGRISALVSDAERGEVLVLDAPKATMSKTAAKKATANGIIFPLEIPLREVQSAIVEVEF
jgi:ribosome maturation factor RimP